MYYEQVLLNRFSLEISLCSGRLDQSQSCDALPPPRPRYKESTRFHRQFRQSWQRLYRNQRKNRLFTYPGAGRLCLIKKKPKWELAGQSLDQDDINNAWEGVATPLIAVAFAAAFRSLLERCKKCVRLSGEFTEKS
jgi:hypothetical protein